MQGNITVAASWNQLNEWQIQEIAHLYFNTPPDQFADAYLKMIFIVFQNENTPEGRRFLNKLLSEIPVSELEKHTGWLLKSTEYYKFPEIPGLIKPTDSLGNITIRQFSTIDLLFHQWHKSRELAALKRLAASLYRNQEKYFDYNLPEVDKITRSLSQKELEAIALAFFFTRMAVAEQYPIVFPKKQEPEKEPSGPVFRKIREEYIPFDKTIISMAMDELQPLGKKQDVNDTLMWEFFAVLSESILYHQKKAKANERK